MPSALTSKPAPPRHDDLDNYDVGDLSDDPFGSPSPPSSAKKRKGRGDDLGINEEVSVAKRARVPNVKLDEARLLSEAGIPRLRKRARDLKLKGKGHEFSDAARLLSFYQLWLDDLFPKAKFLDALAMVEKAGHKKTLMTARNEWISEGKPKESAPAGDDDDDADFLASEPGPSGVDAAGRVATPPRGDVPDDDDDIYNATPRRSRIVPITATNDDGPDEDDLDALMAEAETQDRPAAPPPPRTAAAADDEDDLDALIAEAEVEDQGKASAKRTGKQGSTEFEDDEAAMQEMDGLW